MKNANEIVGRVQKKEIKIDNEEQYLKELFKDPLFLDRVLIDGLDHKIAGEEIARIVVFLCAIGSYVVNSSATSYNLMVNSESGAGKDHLVRNVLSLFPEQERAEDQKVHYRSRISPTALTYWHNSLFEPHWTWNGKVLYLEDVNNEILNCDVFKVFTSNGSYATIVKDQRAIDIKIKGKPVVIITSASATPEPELLRRFLVINLNETVEQTTEVMHLIEKKAKNGKIEEEENDYIKALSLLKPAAVKIPFSDMIRNYFPKDNIITRTNYARFFDFIKSSTVLFQYNREIDEEGYLLATGEDYDIARKVFLATSCNSDLVPLTMGQKEIIDLLKEIGKNVVGEGLNEKEVGWSVQQLLIKLPMSKAQLYRELNKLSKLKYVSKEQYKGDFDTKPYTVYSYKQQNDFNLPKWEEVVSYSQ